MQNANENQFEWINFEVSDVKKGSGRKEDVPILLRNIQSKKRKFSINIQVEFEERDPLIEWFFTVDAGKAKAVKGVKHVVQIDSGIAVVADGFWPALQGRKALTVEWDDGPNADLSSAGIRKQFADAVGSGVKARQDGDEFVIDGAKMWLTNGGTSNLTAVLVRTGKFREDALRASGIEPPAIADSIAGVPALVAGRG